MKKLQQTKKHNLEWRKQTKDGIFYLNFGKLSDKQKKILHELYLEYIQDGLKSKEAIVKAFQIVSCFKI